MGWRTFLFLTLVTTLTAGCFASAGGDKTGGDVVVLRLATIDAVDNNGQSFGPVAFVRALEDVSDGRIQVEVDTETYGDGSVESETEIVQAISDGRIDGGWPSTRAFAAAGIEGLELAEAPLTLTSYDAVRDLVDSELAQTLLARLDGSGVEGLGLAVGPLRRPFSATGPLLGPEDWVGMTFRSYNSSVQDAAVRAWGGTPLHVGEKWDTEVDTGELDGVELDVAQYHSNGMTTQARHLTSNVVLWPKVFVLSLSSDRYHGLTPEQQDWVQEAAAVATAASIDAEYDETSLVQDLCAAGLELHAATGREVARLHAAIRPVLDELADDHAWAALQALAKRHPEPEALALDACQPAPLVRHVDRLRVPDTQATIPDGVYRNDVSVDELAALHVGPAAEGATGVWTLTVADGTFELDCTPRTESSGIDCYYTEQLGPGFDASPLEVGTLTGAGHTMWFEHDTSQAHRLSDCTLPASETGETSCLPWFAHRVDWSLDDNELVMSNLVSTSPSYQLISGAWTKIE
jgi:TRAP-type C4-dicarboxylate transport system substrate-binding protein